MTQLALSLDTARRLRDSGIARVSANNADWLKAVREVARKICREKGWVCADDLREWCAANDFHPTHYNAYGAVFSGKQFVPGEYIVSAQPQGHANRVRRWRLA